MSKVAKLSPATNGPLRAVDFLAEQGIAVEIARHLPGTHLDGAAMESADGARVIGLTLRYDRIDHFWYTLEHELAHALFHLDDDSGSFFDDFGLDSADDKEEDADNRANESLIPADAWMASEVRTNPSPMAVIGLAHELGIHPAIVAGRARHERQDYGGCPSLWALVQFGTYSAFKWEHYISDHYERLTIIRFGNTILPAAVRKG